MTSQPASRATRQPSPQRPKSRRNRGKSGFTTSRSATAGSFYKDLALDAEWGMNDINLHIPGVYFSGEKTDVGAVLNFAEGGSLSTDVGYNIESSEFDIGIRLQDFALAGTLPYFRQSLDVTAVDGRLSADIRLRGNTEHLLSLTTEGTASLAGFALRDRQQRPVAGVDTLGVKLAEGDLGKMRFVFDRIYVSGLSALFEMTPEGNNLAALMKSPAAETASPTAVSVSAAANPAPEAAPAPAAEITASDAAGSATPSPTHRIADLEITNGRVTVRDLTMHRPFEYTVSEIRMRSRDFAPLEAQQHDRRCADAEDRLGEAALGRDARRHEQPEHHALAHQPRPARLRSLLRTLHGLSADQGQPHVPQPERNPQPLPRRHQPPRHVRTEGGQKTQGDQGRDEYSAQTGAIRPERQERPCEDEPSGQGGVSIRRSSPTARSC